MGRLMPSAGRRRLAGYSRPGSRFLAAFGLAALAVGAGRALTTTYLPVLLERMEGRPSLIGLVMLINPVAGFAVPLAVGLWSDRVGGRRPRLPFLVGGVLLAAGGLVAVGFGSETSYVTLAAAGLAVYVGLNAAATAHRTIVAERFVDRDRPAATSAQEVERLVGGGLGVVVGGALIAGSSTALFVGAAIALPLLAAPTVMGLVRHLRSGAVQRPERDGAAGAPALPDLVAVLRQPGPRALLIAQMLWVLAYVALPTFFILYARNVFGLGAGTASLLLAGLGLVTGAGMLLAGATRPDRVCRRLMAGAALLGGGLLAAAPFRELTAAAPPFAAAALGFGLVTALGYPYFARLIPAGEAGRYSGLYFAARAAAAAVALPLGGLLVEVVGSYQALLFQGGAALAALVPLTAVHRLERGGRATEDQRRDHRVKASEGLRSVGAVIRCRCDSEALERVVRGTLRHVDELVVVDEGCPQPCAERLAGLTGERVRVLRRDGASGKGDAVAAGVERLLARPGAPEAVLVMDCDGRHPPESIPDFVEAARRADIVIGNRRGQRQSMPWLRRIANDVSSSLLSFLARRRLPDSQCGMRLYRRDALERVPPAAGRCEAETRHLKTALRAGLTVEFVAIPAVYDGEPSSFRPVRDSARVLAAIVAPAPPQRRYPSWGVLVSGWAARLALLMLATVGFGYMVLPLLQPLEEWLFLAINSLGDGPEVLWDALDPHIRNYTLLGILATSVALLRRWVSAPVVALAVIVAGFLSLWLLHLTYDFFDRPRPSEVLPRDEILLSHGNTWAGIAAFPSGHLVVTTAIAGIAMAVAPALRVPLWIYIGAVGFTRVLFGAHFVLDSVAGIVFGYEVARFVVALLAKSGLVPGPLAGGAAPFPELAHLSRRAARGRSTSRPSEP